MTVAASGRLYLLPAALGEAPWQATLPSQVRDIACGIDYFIVENAKSARAELKRIGHPRSLRHLDIVELPRDDASPQWASLLAPLAAGRDAALMSEAGCPAVADPGALLVRAAHVLGVPVVPLVGPSAIMLGLMASGLNGQSFAFHGYLPVQNEQRRQRIIALERESARERRTQIFIETPYRNLALHAALLAACRDATMLCIASALTTPHEAIATRSIAEWRRHPAPEINKRPTLFLLLASAV